MQTLLLASGAWVLDIAFFVILIAGIALGAHRGFVKSICKLAGKWFALIFAVCFCVSFANLLGAMGLTGAIAKGLANSFENNETLAIALPFDVEGSAITAELGELGVNGFYSFLIGLGFKHVDLIPQGTTVAHLLGSTLAKWLVIAISFILLIVIVRVGFGLLGKTFSGLISKLSPLRVVDQALGGVFGLLKSAVLIFLILLLCDWLPFTAIHDYIASSTIVGAIFQSNWFISAASYAVSGEWFTEYIAKLL